MTTALIVLNVIWLVAIGGLVYAGLRLSRRLRRAEEHAAAMTDRLAEAVDLLEEAETRTREAEVRAGAAEGRLRAAEQRATDAERRAGDAERRVAEAQRQAAASVEAAARSDPARAVWELERLRVEREWVEVAGPGVGLPAPWDGTIAAVVATELSVIREVMGTPSDLSIVAGAGPADPARAAVTARATVELLRTLARSGYEMAVEVAPERLSVEQPLGEGEEPPDLAGLAAAAGSAGLVLSAERGDDRWRVTLAFGAPAGG